MFEREGVAAAWSLGLRLKLKPSSLRVWFSRWHHAAMEAKRAKVGEVAA
jgi:hypothetical protein